MAKGLIFYVIFFGGFFFIRRRLMAVQQGHRKRIEAAGYQERDKPKRLRFEKYWRIWFWIFMAMNLPLYVLVLAFTGGRDGVAAAFGAMSVAAIPSMLVAQIFVRFAEYFHPNGQGVGELIPEYVRVTKDNPALGTSTIQRPEHLNALGDGPLEKLPPAKSVNEPKAEVRNA